MSSTLTKNVKVHSAIKGMWVCGYMTITRLPNDSDADVVYYGTFDTIEQATEWAVQLDNAEIIPLYYPTYNRG